MKLRFELSCFFSTIKKNNININTNMLVFLDRAINQRLTKMLCFFDRPTLPRQIPVEKAYQ